MGSACPVLPPGPCIPQVEVSVYVCIFFFPFSKLHKARDTEHISVHRANPHPNAGSGREPCQSLRVGSTQKHCSSNCQVT